jgi:hypothetical protein
VIVHGTWFGAWLMHGLVQVGTWLMVQVWYRLMHGTGWYLVETHIL